MLTYMGLYGNRDISYEKRVCLGLEEVGSVWVGVLAVELRKRATNPSHDCHQWCW